MEHFFINQMYDKSIRLVSDIHLHLPTLMEYASECNHVTEMGVREVVSTWAFIKGIKGGRLVSYDIIRSKSIDLVERICKEVKLDFEFKLEDTLKASIEETDFLFIDTLHTYKQLSSELKLHANKAKKYLGFHDTFTFGYDDEDGNRGGLMPAIEEFLAVNPQWTIEYQTDVCNGLTILKRK